MSMFSPAEITQNYSGTGRIKTERPLGKMLVLAVLAGLLVAFAAAATNTAIHSIENVSAARAICGLLFPFCLAMVMLSGAELFTGNCLIVISVLNRVTNTVLMLRNWLFVYLGNFVGGLLLAAGCAFTGQMNYSGGQLAVYTIKIAAYKCGFSFVSAITFGFFCNVLVCMGVICAYSAKDTAGRIMGAYISVAFFVICGFEHSIANMYYIPAGLFAMWIPRYAQLAAEAGIDTSMLTWGNFFVRNLLPVTIGNILGGVLLGVLMWFCHMPRQKQEDNEKQEDAKILQHIGK